MGTQASLDTDAALVERARSGERAAFQALVHRHQDGVYGMALRFSGHPEEARDLAQEAFIRIFHNLHQFRGESRFSTWAYVIVRNLAYARSNRLQRELAILDQRDAENEGSWAERLEASGSDPAREYLEKDTHLGVQAAMMELPEKYRLVIALHHFQEMGYAEIATVLGLPMGTVKTHLFRAKAALKTILEARGLI